MSRALVNHNFIATCECCHTIQAKLNLIQNVGQHHFYDVAKYEKISPKESINIKELRPI